MAPVLYWGFTPRAAPIRELRFPEFRVVAIDGEGEFDGALGVLFVSERLVELCEPEETASPRVEIFRVRAAVTAACEFQFANCLLYTSDAADE